MKISTGHASGAISKSITVNTNITGAESTITLIFKGEVWQAVQVTPPSAAFGRLSMDEAGKSASRKVTIQNNVEGELKLSEPVSNNPKFKAELTPIEAGKKYELTVTLVPPLVNGNNTGKIEMSTGLAEFPKVEVAVYAFATAAVDVTPTSIAIPPTRTGDTARQLYIRSNNNKPITITDLASSNPAIKLELTDIKGSTTYRLKVDIPADYAPRPGEGDQITFKTDEPSVPLITVPITVMGLPARPAMPVRPAPRAVGAPVKTPPPPGQTGAPPEGGVKPAPGAEAKPATPPAEPKTAEKKEGGR